MLCNSVLDGQDRPPAVSVAFVYTAQNIQRSPNRVPHCIYNKLIRTINDKVRSDLARKYSIKCLANQLLQTKRICSCISCMVVCLITTLNINHNTMTSPKAKAHQHTTHHKRVRNLDSCGYNLNAHIICSKKVLKTSQIAKAANIEPSITKIC